MNSSRISNKLIGITFLVALLITYPFLSVYDDLKSENNSVSTLAFLFFIWLLGILLIGIRVNQKK